jgi:SAM-dependent methyltransferase
VTSGDAPAKASTFDRYATWYDAFNAGKDYASESQYLLNRVRTAVPSPQTWLDIGCGTGHHLALLQAAGISVVGVDASPSMIAQARVAHPSIEFHVGSAQAFDLGRNRDVVSMLFHVMSYQTSDDMIRGALERISAHLAPQGVLLFDFWHTDAVLRDPPGVRVRDAQVGGRRLVRIAHPTEDRKRHRIDIRYEFRWDSLEGPLVHEESHAMRHFTLQELNTFLAEAGLSVLACEAWMQDRALSQDDWYGLMWARRTLAEEGRS